MAKGVYGRKGTGEVARKGQSEEASFKVRLRGLCGI